MVRVKIILLVLFAAAIAVGPAFHNHSLIPASGPDLTHATNFCAACVAATARLVSPGAAVATPVLITTVLVPEPVIACCTDARGPVPSRAPPAA